MKRPRWMMASLAALLLAAVGGWWLSRRIDRPSPPPRFAIVDVRGYTILSAEQIVCYDWATHAITLQPGTWLSVWPEDGESYHHGIPFLVVVDGEVCYRGLLTIAVSSVSYVGHVIDVLRYDGLEDVVKIEFRVSPAHPGPQTDARSDDRVRAALHSLGKLAE